MSTQFYVVNSNSPHSRSKSRPRAQDLFLALPNLLTAGRIAVIPFIVGLFYYDEPWAVWTRTALFALACVTDYLDGYFARTYNQVSHIGRVLDPLADKLLVVSTLIMLVGFQVIPPYLFIPVLLIVAREIAIPGLRELMESSQFFRVSKLAKWKTVVQMSTLALFMMDYQKLPCPLLHGVAEFGLWIAAFLTIWSGYLYWKKSSFLYRPDTTKDKK